MRAVIAVGPPHGDRGPGESDLPPYLAEPRRPVVVSKVTASRLRARWAVVRGPATSTADPGTAPLGPSPVPPAPELSPRFSRAIGLPAAALPTAVCQWWKASAIGDKGETVTVEGKLRLGRPSGRPGDVWSMRGRLRRPLRWHGVPVVVELSPLYGKWTRMNLNPQVRVLTSRRYFRVGHRVLDRLSAALIETWSAAGVTADNSPADSPSRPMEVVGRAGQ